RWPGRTAHWQSEVAPAESPVWQSAGGSRHSGKCAGCAWHTRCLRYLQAVRHTESVWSSRPTRPVGNAIRHIELRNNYFQSPSDYWHSCFGRSRNGPECTDSYRRHPHDYGREYHRNWKQDQQEIDQDLRSREELPALRIYLGS